YFATALPPLSSPLFSSILLPPPRSPLFPYTTLFRSHPAPAAVPRFPNRPRTAGRSARRPGVRPFRARVVGSTRRCRRGVEGETRSEEHTSDSSHLGISYAVFCLKKKKKKKYKENQYN